MSDSLEPGESPGLLLWRVTLAWQRQIAAALRPLGLTHVQFVLLTSTWWLTHQGGERPSQRRLAEFAGIDVMMTSQVLRTLEGRGLVSRETDSRDSRARIIQTTHTGRELALAAVQVVESVDQDFFQRVSLPDALAILRALDG